MNKRLFLYEIIGFVLVSVTGTLNHFLFEWLNSSVVIALFCPVNESVWEHLKLLFFPYLLWTVIECFLLKRPSDFFRSKMTGVICGLIFITSFFYTYSGAFGTVNTFIDILSYFIGTAVSFIISYEFIKKQPKRLTHKRNDIYSVFCGYIGLVFYLYICNTYDSAV